MELIIKPVDIWLFRDGRPFLAGEDHDAISIFPPTPFTLQGAIRTKVLVDKGVDLTSFANQKQPDPDVGYGDNFGKLRLLGPLLAREEDGKWERLIPVPADLVKVDKRLWLLKPQILPFKTNLPSGLQMLWAVGREVGEIKGWLPESEWAKYLQGEAPSQIVKDDELFAFEPRFGIAIERSKRTTQTGMLYRATFVRLKDKVALWAKVDWEGRPSWEGELPSEPKDFGSAGASPSQSEKDLGSVGASPSQSWEGEPPGEPKDLGSAGVSPSREGMGNLMRERGFLRFGGEGRSASYEKINPLPSFASYAPKVENRFKVVLISPAWFSGGWQPADGDWGKVFGKPVRLVAVALTRPNKFGGFDVAKERPKPIRNFVPAGSVYFFESDEPIQLPEDFAFTETPESVREANGNTNAWANIGLGKVLVGTW